MSSKPKCQPILDELCAVLGYSLASRDPRRFDLLVASGAVPFAEAVLAAEGLDPALHAEQFQAVMAIVGKYIANTGPIPGSTPAA